jgi:hypothetical protein
MPRHYPVRRFASVLKGEISDRVMVARASRSCAAAARGWATSEDADVLNAVVSPSGARQRGYEHLFWQCPRCGAARDAASTACPFFVGEYFALPLGTTRAVREGSPLRRKVQHGLDRVAWVVLGARLVFSVTVAVVIARIAASLQKDSDLMDLKRSSMD